MYNVDIGEKKGKRQKNKYKVETIELFPGYGQFGEIHVLNGGGDLEAVGFKENETNRVLRDRVTKTASGS